MPIMRRVRVGILCPMIAIIFALGCSEPAAAQKPTTPAFADRSVSTADYVRLGLPAPNKAWTGSRWRPRNRC